MRFESLLLKNSEERVGEAEVLAPIVDEEEGNLLENKKLEGERTVATSDRAHAAILLSSSKPPLSITLSELLGFCSLSLSLFEVLRRVYLYLVYFYFSFIFFFPSYEYCHILSFQ